MLSFSNQLHSEDGTPSADQALAIAIDGPAGAGKSTVAQKVAAKLGYLYIDTGAMYRAATWIGLDNRADFADHGTLVNLLNKSSIDLKPPNEESGGRIRVFVNGSDVTMVVRSRIVTKFVSQLATIPDVRKLLVQRQQELAARGAVVMDGRDIGTVVLPNADVKIFLTASAQVRAERRLKELKELGQAADMDTLIKEIEARDHQDSTRETSPLRCARDAVVINSDCFSIDQVVEKVLEIVVQKTKSE